MDMGLLSMVMSGLSLIATALMLAGLAVLWSRTRTPGSLLALIGSAGSATFRLLTLAVPGVLGGHQFLPLAWTLTAIMVGVGILMHALAEPQRAIAGTHL